jgi:hypothetical protein
VSPARWACERDVMVAVLDQVRALDLENGDRRHVTVRERQPLTGQSALATVGAWGLKSRRKSSP